MTWLERIVTLKLFAFSDALCSDTNFPKNSKSNSLILLASFVGNNFFKLLYEKNSYWRRRTQINSYRKMSCEFVTYFYFIICLKKKTKKKQLCWYDFVFEIVPKKAADAVTRYFYSAIRANAHVFLCTNLKNWATYRLLLSMKFIFMHRISQMQVMNQQNQYADWNLKKYSQHRETWA